MKLGTRIESIGVWTREDGLSEVWARGKFGKKKRKREGVSLTGGTEEYFRNLYFPGF